MNCAIAFVRPSFRLHSRPLKVTGACQRSSSLLGTTHTRGARKPKAGCWQRVRVPLASEPKAPGRSPENPHPPHPHPPIFGRTSTSLPGTAIHGGRSDALSGPSLKTAVVLLELNRFLFFLERCPFSFLLLHTGKRFPGHSAATHSREGSFSLTWESALLQRSRA